MKKWVLLGMFVFGTFGGWLGSLIDHSGIGVWSFLFSTIGSIFGIWAGYKAGQNLS